MVQEEIKRITQLTSAAIEPGEVGSLGPTHPDSRQFPIYKVRQKVSISLEVNEQFVEPRLPVTIGRFGANQTDRVHPGHESFTSRTKLLTELRIRDDGKRTLQTRKVERLARRDECNGVAGDLWIQGCDGNVLMTIEQKIAMNLVRADRDVG